MKNYEGMRLPSTLDRTTRNELLKVDKYLRQSSVVLAKIVKGKNYPTVVVKATTTGPGGAGNLPDHTHARTGQGGGVLGDAFSTIQAKGQWIYNGTTTPQIQLGDASSTSILVSFYNGTVYNAISWADNPNLGDPMTTADALGCIGARFYTYKDPAGTYDNGYGQASGYGWVLAGPEGVGYSIFCGNHPSAPFLVASWPTANGDLVNYGNITIRKNLGAVVKSTPELRLERTGTGTQYMALRPASSISASFTYVFPGSATSGLFNVSASGSTGTISMLTATRGALLYGNSTPAWAVLAAGAVDTFIRSDGTDVLQTENLAKTGTAKVDLIGQGGNIAATNLVASGHTAGAYRVSVVGLDTAADALATGVLQVAIGWTDNAGATTQNAFATTLPLNAAGRASGEIILRSTGAAAITYAATVTGTFGTAQYALYVRVERLG